MAEESEIAVASVQTAEPYENPERVGIDFIDKAGQSHRLVFDSGSLSDLSVAQSRATEICSAGTELKIYRISGLFLALAPDAPAPILSIRITSGFDLNFEVSVEYLAEFVAKCAYYLAGLNDRGGKAH